MGDHGPEAFPLPAGKSTLLDILALRKGGKLEGQVSLQFWTYAPFLLMYMVISQ
jgi:hypothetical protein